MINITQHPSSAALTELLKRPLKRDAELEDVCKEIFTSVSFDGDEAVRKYSKAFDGVELDDFYVSEAEFEESDRLVSERLKRSIRQAKGNIESFHRLQIPEKKTYENNGIRCWQEARPIEKIGLYIPGGSAPLLSTVLMLAIPASLAGCREITLMTPPDRQGRINPAILWSARLCGVSRVLKIGGIQAIAAVSIGTESIDRVDKIFGPGNQYVMAAKQYSTKYGMAIDMPAGPSEVLVIGDSSADPVFVASDLLSQAEHGRDSQVIFLTDNEALIGAVEKEIDRQMKDLERIEIIEQALSHSKIILLDSIEECIRVSNRYAPEHLILAIADREKYLGQITAAGSVFLGNYSPESAGDYASGTNHTLPTNGNARAYSGVNMDAFFKKITFQELSREGLLTIADTIEAMAEAECLKAHKNAVVLRVGKQPCTD